MNGWLSPTELGSFTRESTLEIRDSLSIQDSARFIAGAADPKPADLIATVEEYRLLPGDVVNVFIHELRQRGADTAHQATVDSQGMIDLPAVGWLKASGLTAYELEEKLKHVLADRDILYDAEVLVQFAAQRGMTYTLFGNESLAVRLNRGPGVFPIPRPEFRLLDALSIAGGLSELVSEVYIFRRIERDEGQARALQALRTGELPGTAHELDAPSKRENGNPLKDNMSRPVQPGVILSDGLTSPSGASTRATYAARANAALSLSQESRDPQPTGDKNTQPNEPNNNEIDPRVQEIMDLMLPESAPQAAHDTIPADRTSGQPSEPTVPLQGQSGVSNWVFDTVEGKWIELNDSDDAGPYVPEVPTGDNDVKPAVDWEAIASLGRQNRIIRISAESLRRGDPKSNIVIRAGDVVRLYSGDIGFYYMTGHILRPGVYAFRSGSSVTLKNAVAAAGGLDALGWPSRVTVYRRIGEREQMIQVDLDRIYAGIDADFFLKRDDIVNFGTHPFAPFLFQIRNFTIPQLSGTISYGVAYRYTRQETFFKNENLAQQDRPSLFP